MNNSIKQEWIDAQGKKWQFEYFETGDFSDLPYDRVKQCYAVCFCGDKIVIGFGGNKKAWGLIGGSIESGEEYIETLTREIQEESNMKVINALPLGYQKVSGEVGKVFYQLRYMAIVEPIADFIEDPAKGITEIKLIDPKEYKNYFDWGDIGDAIIQKAISIKNKIKN